MPENDDIRKIAAELEIRNALALVAQHSDDGPLEAYGDLFAPDAVWEMTGAPRRDGRADIVAAGAARRATGETGPGSNSRHVLTTVSVDVNGDHAVAQSYWFFYTSTDTSPSLRSMGKYIDAFERIDGQWKLRHRDITLG